MVEKSVVIENESGLHARPAAQLSNFVKGYEGSVVIINGDRSGDAKSILNLLSMGIKKGTEIKVQVTGEDEENFANSLADFITKLEG